jgi:hypothetical protein
MRAATFVMAANGSAIAPTRKSVRARFAIRMYEGLCSEAVFQIEYRISEFKSTAVMAVIENVVDTAMRKAGNLRLKML